MKMELYEYSCLKKDSIGLLPSGLVVKREHNGNSNSILLIEQYLIEQLPYIF